MIWKFLTKIAVAGLLVGALFSQTAQASTGDDVWLAGVRNATAPFHDVSAATHANYAAVLSCFDLPGVGGMGQHYLNGNLVNGTVQPNTPQALVYEVDGDRLQLVAIEYIIPWTLWVPSTPPELNGHTFTSVTSLHLWALHAWIWRPNPLGMFANYNPNVELCPGH